MLGYTIQMEIGSKVDLNMGLVQALVECGREGHRVAQAHHNDPGSNGFTFGTDRYQRSTELAAEILKDHGFGVTRRGAGLVARLEDLELQFAVARGADLSDPASFDAESSPARRKAGASNAYQLTFDGMPEPQVGPIVHIVWSGTPEGGQTAVHAGRLVTTAGDRLEWAVLVRLDGQSVQSMEPRVEVPAMASYSEQPEPTLVVAARSEIDRSNEG
jgi:hypothetical protein